jgi:UDP-3-O-[3-hydroxymyristoyl] glucosamine N-acyltransferase
MFKVLHAPIHENEIRRAIGMSGEGECSVEGLATLDEPADRCLYFTNATPPPEFRSALENLRECIVIAPAGVLSPSGAPDSVILETADPRAAIARVLEFVRQEGRVRPWVEHRQISPDANISPLAIIEGDVDIDGDVVIEPFCFVGPQVRIGRGVVIRSGARIYPRVTIGEQSVIGSQTVNRCVDDGPKWNYRANRDCGLCQD